MPEQDSEVYRQTDPAQGQPVPVSVILVTIKAKDYIYACLDSLRTQTHPPFEIIVMDNSLCPDLAQELSRRYPEAKVYSSGRNLFYTGALNKGIAVARGKFILCLNDDLILDREFIRRGLEGFLAKDKIGMVSGKILRPDKQTLDSTGLFLSFWLTARERGYGQPDTGRFNQQGYIFGVSGAAAFYRKDMLEQIKQGNEYFDGRFEMFYEDLDIAWRARRNGWQAYYVPEALAYHLRGGSFRPDSGINRAYARRYLNDQLHYNLIKNRYLTIMKNGKFFDLLLRFVPLLIYELAVWGYVILFRPKVLAMFLQKGLTAGGNFENSK